MPSPAKDPDDLYGLPLEEFVAARTALAKAMRSAGRRQEAADVAALRKPSVAAWAVNQLARSQRRALGKLLKAGDELKRIQADLLAGRADRTRMSRAMADERAAVDELVDLARGLLSGAGQELSATTLDRVATSLHAAALEDDAREAVQAGRLDREVEHVGLGPTAMASGSPPASPGRTGRPGAKGDGRRRPPPAVDKQAERKRAERVKAARQAESKARRAAERAARDLQQAEAHHEEASRWLREAEQALEMQRGRAEKTKAEHGCAEAALREAQGNS